MANILVLTPQLPYPPHQGTSLRNYHLLRALSNSHTISLLSFAEPNRPQELDPLHAIAHVLLPVDAPTRSTYQRIGHLVQSTEPDLALRLKSDEFERALIKAIRNNSYDAIQFEGLEMARYIRSVKNTTPNMRVVLDCHNVETELQRRSFRADLARPSRWPASVYSGLQKNRLVRYERWACNASDSILVVSQRDKENLVGLGINLDKTINVIPNTIDVKEYERSDPGSPEYQFDLVFTGKMDYRPNIDGVLWFAEHVWPQILETRPETTWAIVGQQPHRRLDPIRQLQGVTMIGRVPSIQPYLHGATVYIVPLRIGSGSRLKLIEAMAAGNAVVSTTLGAEGFPVSSGANILLADSPSDWATSILALLADEPRRAALGAAAKDFAAHYDWRHIIPELDRIYAILTTKE